MHLSDLTELELVRATVILEAGGEPLLGKLLVGAVIRERLMDQRWPDTWHGVVLQPKQFSCWNNVSRDAPVPEHLIRQAIAPQWNAVWWRECQFAAWGAVYDYYRHPLPGANHYHREDLRPSWTESPAARCLGHVGRHLFWRL